MIKTGIKYYRIKSKDILIPDASANLIWFMQSYKTYSLGQKIFTALNHSPMGYSVPAAVGAFFGKPSSRVLAFIGDGSMQMNIQELETIKHYKINTKILEIKPVKGGDEFKNISRLLKLKHKQINIKPLFKSSTPQNGLLICSIKKIKKALNLKNL